MHCQVLVAVMLLASACQTEAADRWQLETPYGTASGVARLDDGDSLRIGPTWVRIDGIDAPEKGPSCVDLTDPKKDRDKERCWLHAKDALADIMLSGGICRGFDGPKNKDSMGRWLVTCVTEGGIDVGAEMVSMGMACAATRYTLRYLPLEIEARMEKKGLWSPRFTYSPSAMCTEGR